MDDFSLDDLMAELDAVQAEETKHKLSERNCVEILQTLMKSGLLRGLMYTLDGKEYLTPEQLKREVRYELQVAGGRVSLGAVEIALNLDSSYIESKTKELIKDDSSLQLISNGSEIISEQYVSDLIDEITEQLLEGEGHVTVGDLATKYGLSVDFMSKALEKRKKEIANKVHMKHGVLYTNGFVDRHKGRVLGALNAVTKPISIQKLVQLHDFIDNEMVEDVIKKSISNKTLNGTLRGNEFIPDVFGRMQHLACESFFEANGYLPKERARKVRITDAAKFLKQKHPNSINLNTYVIDESVFDRLEAVVMEEVVTGKKWTSISNVFDDIPFDEKDIKILGELCNKKLDQCIPIGFDFLVSNEYLKHCRTMLSSNVREIAIAEANAVAYKDTGSNNNNNKRDDNDDDDYSTGKSRKKGGKGKKGKKGKRDDDDFDDYNDNNNSSKSKGKGKKGKGKKGKKGKRGKRNDDDDDEDDDYNNNYSNNNNKSKNTKLSSKGNKKSDKKRWRVDDVEKLLLKHDSNLKKDCERLLIALGTYLFEFAKNEYEKAYNESIAQVSKSGASNTRDILNALEKIFHTQYASLQNYAKSCIEYRKLVEDVLLQMAQEDDDDDNGSDEDKGSNKKEHEKISKERSTAVAKHLGGLKKMCIDACSKKILAIIVGMEASKAGIDLLHGRNSKAQTPKDKAMEIVELLSDLAICRNYIDTSQLSASKSTMIKLFDTTKSGPDDLLELLPSIATECDLLLKKTDKKAHKHYVFTQRKKMIEFFDNKYKSEGEIVDYIVFSKADALLKMAKLVFLSNGILLPEEEDEINGNKNNNANDDDNNNNNTMTPFSLLMIPTVGKILTPSVHTWLTNISTNDIESITEKEVDILREISVTKKLSNLDDELFQ